MIYNSNEEILWMLLSILSLPVDVGAYYISKDVSLREGTDNVDDNFIKFTNALEIYQYSWIDEFDFLYDPAKSAPSRIQRAFSDSLGKLDKKDMDFAAYCKNQNWENVRNSGKNILRLTGLPLYEPVSEIDYFTILEFIYDADGRITRYN